MLYDYLFINRVRSICKKIVITTLNIQLPNTTLNATRNTTLNTTPVYYIGRNVIYNECLFKLF